MHTAIICHSCGAEVPATSAFCQSCGVALASPVAVSAENAAPWTIRDMLKAIGIIFLVLVVTAIPFLIAADAVAGDVDPQDDPTALAITLGAGFFLELALLGTAVHFSVRKYHLPLAALGLKWPDRGGFWSILGHAVLIVIAATVIVRLYSLAMSAVGISPKTEIEEIFQDPAPLVVLVLLSLLFAPLMEEVFFRGFVFGGLRARWGLGRAAFASGLLFALAHIGNPGTFYLIPPIAAIGALFAWRYAHSGSLLPVLLAHFLINLFAVGGGIAQYS